MAKKVYNKRIWVSKEYREWVKAYLSLPNDDRGHWNFLEYILLKPRYERETKSILASHTYIKTLYETRKSSIDCLQEFQTATKIMLNVSDYCSFYSKCRTITPKFSPELLNKTQQEQGVAWDKKIDKVLFSTGETHTDYLQRKIREKELLLIKTSEISVGHPAYNAVKYLHSTRIQNMLNNQLRLYKGEALMEINKIKDEDRRLYGLMVYNAMSDIGYVKYDECEKSTRCYPAGHTMLHLPREVRKKFMSGTWSVDLKQAQLAIACMLWNLPLTEEFLKSGNNLWKMLADYQDVNLEYKPVLKELVYSICYGRSARNIKKFLIAEFGNDLLINHWMVKELLAERTRQLDLIKENKGTFDAYGIWHTTELENKTELSPKKFILLYNHFLRSILCTTIQSYETKLMLNLFDYIIDTNRLDCIAWLHDGLYIIGRNDTIKYHLEFLNSIIIKEAQNLNIDIILDIEFINLEY